LRVRTTLNYYYYYYYLYSYHGTMQQHTIAHDKQANQININMNTKSAV